MELEEIEKTVVKITESISKDQFASLLDAAYRKVAPTISVKGFRKGHAPKNAFLNIYGEEALYEDAIEIYIDHVFDELIKKGYHPIDIKDMDIPNGILSDGFDLVVFIYHQPEITLGNYKGVSVRNFDLSSVSEVVDDVIKNDFADYLEYEKIDEKILLGNNFGKFHLEVFLDEKEIDNDEEIYFGLEDEIHFIKGFETRCFEGMLVNEARRFKHTVDHDAEDDELAGKEVDVCVTLLGVYKKVLKEITDDMAREVGFINKEEYLDYVNEYAIEEVKLSEEKRILDDAINEIALSSEIYPCPTIVNEYIEQMEKDFMSVLERYGISFDDAFKNKEEKDSYNENNRKMAIDRVKKELILLRIALVENLTASNLEIEDFYKQISEDENIPLYKAKKTYDKEMIEQDIVMEKASKIIMDNIVFKED